MAETKSFLLATIATLYFIFVKNCYCPTLVYHCKSFNKTSAFPGDDDLRLVAPWVASIFKRNEDGIWKHHCGGTLTETFVVITAASCVLSTFHGENGIPYHLKYTDLRIVAGLLTNDFYNGRDKHTQEAGVMQIREHRIQNPYDTGYFTNQSANLAGILLNVPFKLTHYVRPVCLLESTSPISEALIYREGAQAIVAGFNSNPLQNNNGVAQHLSIFKFTTQPSTPCLEAYRQNTEDRNAVCGRLTKELVPESGGSLAAIPCFMEGSGLIMMAEVPGYEELYVTHMGVYTSNTATARRGGSETFQYPRNEVNINTQCNENDMAFFTKHGLFAGWALLHTFCGPNGLQCQDNTCFGSNQLCDGIVHCNDQTDESPEVCFNQSNCTEVEFQCKYGACIDDFKLCDGNMDCADQSDENNDKLCLEADARRNVTCSPIPERIGVETKCYLPDRLNGSLIDNCHLLAVPVGTTAHQFCSRYFQGKAQDIFKCQRNGNWSISTFLTCAPECGISELPKTGFVIGGGSVGDYGEWPWHAAIYKLTNGNEQIHCGGSLISPKVILTAAHCVTEEKTETFLNSTQLRVVLGKLRSSYGENENKFSQELPIETLVPHESYHANTFESDIALIILKSPAKITSSVRTVCLSDDTDFAQEQLSKAMHYNNGTDYFGTAVGFGLDETKKTSVDLKILKMPVVSEKTCISVFPPAKKEIRYVWICGGYTNGSAVCQGDSGGGFVFPYHDPQTGNVRYYVQGIVSHGTKSKNKNEDPCNKNVYKIFTKVEPFAKWIQKVVLQTESENLSKIDYDDLSNFEDSTTEIVSKETTNPKF